MKTVAIITAAGFSQRMGQSKQFLKLGGQTILERTLTVLEQSRVIDSIILVVNEEELERAQQFKFSKLKKVVKGGKERQNSVYNGLQALPQDTGVVVIHDGARPFVTADVIARAVSEAKKSGAVVVGVPVQDTIKQITNDELSRLAGFRKTLLNNNKEAGQMTNACHTIIKTVDRRTLWAAQTPQVFKKEIILSAYQEGVDKYQVTDDAMLVEKLGIPVTIILGSYQNIKITTPADLAIAQALLEEKGA